MLTQYRAMSHAPLSRRGYAGATSNIVDHDIGAPSCRAIAPDKLTLSTRGAAGWAPL
ncbi:MAG TPA: hypothetical protein VEC96_01260 [Anaerolineae bacterium]|nr:hypothetical protein [Anaerolineae bacterium]